MSNEIKPIETYYNGYRFRSRLEARWAVFFDEIGLEYEYEPQGFVLDNGKCYMPDFYFKKLGCYAEVKGYNEHLEDDISKITWFVIGSKKPVIIFSEIPFDAHGQTDWDFPMITSFNGLKNEQNVMCVEFNLMPTIGKIGLFASTCEWRGAFRNFGWYCRFEDDEEVYDAIQARPHVIHGESERVKILNTALSKARQARFEHGETPQIRR